MKYQHMHIYMCKHMYTHTGQEREQDSKATKATKASVSNKSKCKFNEHFKYAGHIQKKFKATSNT